MPDGGQGEKKHKETAAEGAVTEDGRSRVGHGAPAATAEPSQEVNADARKDPP